MFAVMVVVNVQWPTWTLETRDDIVATTTRNRICSDIIKQNDKLDRDQLKPNRLTVRNFMMFDECQGVEDFKQRNRKETLNEQPMSDAMLLYLFDYEIINNKRSNDHFKSKIIPLMTVSVT